MEEGLCGKGRLVKVQDLHHHIIPITQKNLSYMVLNAVNNDAVNLTSRKNLYKLLQLKMVVKERMLRCVVWLLTPTLRSSHAKATLTVKCVTVVNRYSS